MLQTFRPDIPAVYCIHNRQHLEWIMGQHLEWIMVIHYKIHFCTSTVDSSCGIIHDISNTSPTTIVFHCSICDARFPEILLLISMSSFVIYKCIHMDPNNCNWQKRVYHILFIKFFVNLSR